MIVVDALRHDFAVWDDSLDAAHGQAEIPAFRNKLTTIRQLRKTRPTETLLLPCLADAPTTTLQRIKGLTTGGLPTFLDIGRAFGGVAVTVGEKKADSRWPVLACIFVVSTRLVKLLKQHNPIEAYTTALSLSVSLSLPLSLSLHLNLSFVFLFPLYLLILFLFLFSFPYISFFFLLLFLLYSLLIFSFWVFLLLS